ncbi:ubiquitin carboxyl-terminal hydrolase-domain-containing protein [Crucibulum laeve]|uniref:PAN2-PAN3 deadenylation complex catalytic subunit PAN2 n=1 Tax=Crucibulum laeve TaxID=68775 RepID=A0A5C3MFP7_9AGAR|nr:ubiquitin carboxyl-terminal hydrolase-domain-containing protein [Crucibulum laeve]
MASSYRPISPITAYTTFPQPVTALSFDPVSDILWAGSNTGNVTAYYSKQGVRGISFQVGGGLAVNKVIAGDNYVRALGLASEGLGSWAKGGMNKWFFRSSTNITTFSDTTNSSSLAASSSALELLLLNSMTGSVVRKVPTTSLITHLQFSPSILLSGSSDGYLRVHDPRTAMLNNNGSESVVKAHSSSVQGLETSGNLIFTIGMGERQSRPFPDPLVKLYDLRTMRPLPPIPFSSGPAFIQLVPRQPSHVAVVSNQGLINVVDASNASAPSEFYQLDLASYLTSVSISPTAVYMAFGDADGMIHLMSKVEEGAEMHLNGYEGQPTPWVDAPAPIPDIEWSNSTPLNTIGLPYYDNQLLSGWSTGFESTSLKYPPPLRIPPQILNAMKTNDNVAYASLPKELRGRRNMTLTNPRKGNGRFRSGKPRANELEPESAADDAASDVPRLYRHVEIEYSKFGVEDFDFAFYNRTDFSGLETHILNSYTNPLVQVLHYIRPIRRLAKSHITVDCPREHCLLCELGFVSRMLEDARGINCQSSNFCKTVGVLAHASNAIELIDYGRDSAEVDYAHKIQTFHRFLIDHLSAEGNSFPHNPAIVKRIELAASSPLLPAPITQLVGVDGRNVITCLNCRVTREKENMTHVVDLTYPRKPSGNEAPPPADFATIVQISLLRYVTHKATCQSCKQFSSFSSRRSIPSRDLPVVLALNAGVYNDETFAFWQDSRGQKFLQSHIQLHGQFDGIDDPEVATYEIRAMVVKISGKDKPAHLVAIVKVPEAEEQSTLDSPWFVFNDFVVRNVTEAEALSFPDKWKTPAIIYLERKDMRGSLDFSGLPGKIDLTILNQDTSIALNRDPSLIQHDCLRPEEFPTPGTLVAIDAEFVSMQQEETEFRSDGTTKVLRPARLSLARVSVLRGDGPRQGVPFIDDYIHTSEVIVDYLTEFSGIKFGDLDPHISRYTLTPLKLVYKKLRMLVDCGCIFVGHGLSKDFRIINLFVPPDQVIDTVDLYYISSRQRRLSLRFLSWFVLHQKIQTDTHDSIEDAHSALNLYKAYQEFEEKGIFDKKLEELYKEGRQYVCVFSTQVER